ncbi:MAG: hypothetical protein Faunusvirus35_11 [Faunusvirus sp.]|jgi:ankyrin repeat protein|uniref:Uncharacterized protein n=1 Tax=Faunusvirus sp. TaxID=2487766 RepID=A0A3G4ZXP3_9VIRU|nr:MAG: hypothetical protein Faunusvirus35_11 [Faunusvirus sp.]
MTQAHDHATDFVILLQRGCETGCIKYINKYNDFYDTPVDGWSSLMRAIAFRRKNTVIELIRKGANVNYKSLGGSTCLELICIYKYENLAIILIEAGAIFVNIIDSHIVKYNCNQVIQHIKNVYRKQIISVIDSESTDNALAVSFKTVYVAGIIDIISEFII